MNEKTQRYMMRIQKIMLTPKKTGSQYRPSKSPINCKPHNLDKYLKYELSSTIIQNMINKYNKQFVSQFYNAIRTSQYRQKERIYKFIPVENNKKQQHIDIAISAKILITALKSIMRRKYIEFINALQENDKELQNNNPNKNKIIRKKPEREPQSYAVLMRTSTKPELQNYRIIDEWIDGSSNKDSKQNKSSQKIRELALKSIIKTLSSKIKVNKLTAFYQIQNFIRKNATFTTPIKSKQPIEQTPISQPSKSIVKQLPKSQIMNPKQSQKIYKSARSIYILTNLIKKKLSAIVNHVKTKTKMRQIQTQSSFIHFYQTIQYLCLDFKLRNFHFFFHQIKPSLQVQLSSSRMSDQLSSNMGSQTPVKNNNIKNTISKVEEPSQNLKGNFDEFVDKILSFIAVVSKMLIPLKEAFAKIDNYASFSYRLEESLKIAPRRYLLDCFNQIKQCSPSKKIIVNDLVKAEEKLQKFNELVMPIFMERLIQGFIHIKIVQRRQSLIINLTPVKDSIIEDTIKFIRAREQHSSHSFQSWNELKSILLSPPSSEIRGQSKILI